MLIGAKFKYAFDSVSLFRGIWLLAQHHGTEGVCCQVESSPTWWQLCHKVDLHSELDTGLLFASQIPVIAADIRRGFCKKFSLHR